MILAKKSKNGTIDLIDCSMKQGAYVTELRNAGFLDFVPSEQPAAEPGETVV